MKKLLLSFCLIFALALPSYGQMNVLIAGGGVPASGGPAPDCSETFTTGDTGDVAGNTSFDSETDVNSKLSIVSGKMVSDVGTNSQVGYVRMTSCTADTDTTQTHKFKIAFTDILAIDNGTSTNKVFRIVSDTSGQEQANLIFQCASGNLDKFYVQLFHDGGTATSSTVSLAGIVAGTEYLVTFYWTKSATAIASATVGSFGTATTAVSDNSTREGGGASHLGSIDHYWGDGTTDTTITFDDYQVFKSDQR